MTGRNRLADATSPYLLQHADNPVDWWPWSDEAFAEAARRDVPVLLSVGYAACHWCHVMAHESFEDEATAERVNANFVAVKVDREERPDVDAVYMQATQAMTGQGGWPMTVFLTPDRRPFYAGTYFPPRPVHGMPAFRQVLDAIAAAWQDRRDQVAAGAEDIVRQLAELNPARAADSGNAAKADVDAALAQLGREFDPMHAGFGRAPKFPPSMVLEALLRARSDDSLTLAGKTLVAMARGGIHDQLRGGFARYSVDAEWGVPHFEKMLYDNGLLLGDYAHWWRITGDELAREVVFLLVGWLCAEMRTDEGGFAASLDADSLDEAGHLHEGAFYAWSPAQLTEVLGADDGRWAAEVYGVSEAGTFEHGLSTLRRSSAYPRPGGAEADRLESVRSRLLDARGRRSRPGRDDKVVAAWNGWTVDSLVQAAMIFDRPDWVDLARDAAGLVWRVHWVGGRLRRTSRQGRVGSAPAILEDYGALIQAFARVASATTDPAWIDRARELAEVLLSQFDDGSSGFFDTAHDAEKLYVRPQDPTDNATPSGLSAAVHGLRLLAELTGDDRYAARADTAAATAGALVTRAPRFAGWLLADAISASVAAPVQVAIVGPADDPARGALVRTAWRLAPAGSVIVAGVGDDPGFELLADRGTIDGRPAAYVCRHFVCKLPVTTDEALAGLLRNPEATGSAGGVGDQRDRDVVADEAADGARVEDLVKPEPGR